MAYRRLTDRRALVTGASSGIGRALVLELARRGVDVVLLARREERLAEVATQISQVGRRAVIVVGDVSDPDARRRALQAARDQLGGLDILVNNAGVSAHGRFADANPERLRPIMEVNFFAPVELIRAALPLLKESKRAVVVNVGSILGERGIPHRAEYCASKFALHGFSEALRPELERLGIGLLVVAPGATQTEFFEHLLEDHGKVPGSGTPRVSPERVARATVRAIERGRREIIPSWNGWLLVTASRLFPGIVSRVMSRLG